MAHIKLRNISLKIKVKDFSQRSLRKSLVKGLIGGMIIQEGKATYVESLKNISLQIEEGSRVGILGHNGSGKTTLLKLIAGILQATDGNIDILGKISTLFSLGQGMNPELSGVENIVRMGIYNQLSLSEAKSIVDDVLDFSELGEYANFPVKTYSNGMQARLAFGVATSIKPEILLIDEIIGVGDERFQEKASLRVSNLIEDVKILLVASHSKDIINKYCNDAITLKHGEIVDYTNKYSNITVK